MSTAAIFDHHGDHHRDHHREYPIDATGAEAPGEFAIQEQPEEQKEQPSLWRSLLQLKVLLPYLGKILPMLEGNLSTALAPLAPRQDIAPALQEVTRSFGEVNRGFLDLQTGQREMRGQVHEQAVQLKRIDDQLLRLRESTERNTMEHQELVEDLRSASKMVRTLSTAMIVLLIGVTAMVTFMLLHWRH